MAAKSPNHDAEFNPDVLRVLVKREIIGQANSAQYVLLTYNLLTEVESIEQQFQVERRENPLLETTPPDAWLAALLVPMIMEVRSNVGFDERFLGEAVKRYLRSRVTLPSDRPDDGEEKLVTTVEPYLSAVKELVLSLYDRRKSLRSILRLGSSTSNAREMSRTISPSSRREKIILEGIKGNWPNQRIARELDEKGLKPRSTDIWKSYSNMLRNKPQNFYSLRSAIKRKYSAFQPSGSTAVSRDLK